MQATNKMPEFDRINISEGIDVNKTCLSKECEILTNQYQLTEMLLVF